MLDSQLLDRLLDASTEEVQTTGVVAAKTQAKALETLNTWLRARDKDQRARAMVFELLAGMARETSLVWHHSLYWRLTVDSWAMPATSSMVEVLSMVFSMEGPNEYARSNVKKLYRRIYERGDDKKLSERAQRAIEERGVMWELAPLSSLKEAWEVLLALTTTEFQKGASAAGCPNVWEHIEQGTQIAGDVLLARFINANPKVLEREVIDKRQVLSRTGGSDKNALSRFLEDGSLFGISTWSQTHAAWDAALGLRLFDTAQRENLLHETTQHNSVNIAAKWFKRAPDGITGTSREMLDVLRALSGQATLPEILPEDLSRMSPIQIEEALANYSGITVDELYRRFSPGQLSSSGFIRSGEKIGERISADAATLQRLGVSRMKLAEQLQSVIQTSLRERKSQIGDLKVEIDIYMGHQHEPFHLYDVYGLIGSLGACDFTIRRATNTREFWGSRRTLKIQGGDLQASMIRRACFFGGAKCHYRLDPEVTARVLGLL